MRIMGIDPGIGTAGWGVIDVDGNTIRLIAAGALTTPPRTPLPERLALLARDFRAIVADHRPDRAGVEELFFAKNTTTAFAVAQARGVLLLGLAEAGIPLVEFSPPQVKQALTGYGGADKQQMQRMVQTILGLATIPRPDDVADALAVAIAAAGNSPHLGN